MRRKFKVQSSKFNVEPGTRNSEPGTARRSGVTLLEVLFSIMVASVGLLGAIAVFPVALSQARKGRLADQTAVGADAAISVFDGAYMRRPDRWLAWDTTNNQTTFLPIGFNDASTNPMLNGQTLYGRAFCIDPLGFAHNAGETNAQNYANLWSWFPAVPENAMGPNAVPNASRMVRLTLYNNDPTAGLTIAQKAQRPMGYLQAERLFRIEDELMYERPEDNTLPAAQLFTKMLDANGNPVPGRRQEEGRLTWFATLVPKLDRSSSQLGEEYVLSVVVCLNRSGESTHVPDPNVTPRDHPFNEWTATILGANGINAAGDFHSRGIGGGEVTLSTLANTGTEAGLDQFYYSADAIDVRYGSWVMVGRALSGSSGPIQHFQWYRVADVEEDARYVDTDSDNNPDRYQRDVTLVGPDWPADLNGDNVTERCDVIVMPHVAYVYERTIRIDTGAQ